LKLDPGVSIIRAAPQRLFIIDGSKALSKAIRRSFGREALIQRCQIHKARNIMARLPKPLHAAIRRVLRQAWELDDAEKAEKLVRNLARRLEHDAPGVSASNLEGLDEILTVTRLGLPKELRRALACTNIVENVMSCASRLPQREAMAIGLDGPALNRGGHAGSRKRLPTIEGAQATSGTPCRSASTSKSRLEEPGGVGWKDVNVGRLRTNSSPCRLPP
jgi:Transposase, Mutator family